MAQKSLWGDLPEADATATPAQILKYQAAQLANLTAGKLEGRVRMGPSETGGSFELELVIVAPLLGNFEYTALSAEHPVEMYPVTVWPGSDRPLREGEKCATPEIFELAVGEILASDRVRRVIRSLLAQTVST